jgi:hypothetical protein
MGHSVDSVLHCPDVVGDFLSVIAIARHVANLELVHLGEVGC